MHKLACLYTLLFFLCLKTGAQNLVPNGDFEQYTQCPSGLGQLNRCTGWSAYTNGTSDYYNSCSTGNVGVPVNFVGYQLAASGNGYAGFIAYQSAPIVYKEYIYRSIDSMTPGKMYEISLSIALAEISHYATDDIGIYFFKNGPTSISGSSNVPVTPQISFAGNGVFADTANWIRLTKTFVADSSYDHIIIGSFNAPSNMTLSTATGSGPYSYYEVDSVVVKQINNVYLAYYDTLLCGGDSIIAPYSVAGSYFNPGNTFTLQLSDSSGSFVSAVTINTVTSTISGIIKGIVPLTTVPGNNYRLRIIASNPGDTSAISWKSISIGAIRPSKPIANNNGTICEKDSLQLTATDTTSGVKYIWTGPNNFISNTQNPKIINPTAIASGPYIVSAYLYGCKSKDTTNVLVKPLPALPFTATSNSAVCTADTLKLNSSNTISGSTYSWAGPNSFSSSMQNPKIIYPSIAASGKYIITAVLNGCSTKDSVTVLIKPTPQQLIGNSNSPVCIGDTIKLTSSSITSGVSYRWSGPAGFNSSNQNTNILNAIVTGDYIITASLNGCSAKDTLTVLVKPLPVTALLAGSNSAVCNNDSLKLTSANTLPGCFYTWSGPNSFSSGLQNPFIASPSLAYSGKYYVTAALNGCSVIDSTIVIIKQAPIQVAAVSNSPICPGDTLFLSSNSISNVNYVWMGPGGFLSNLQNDYRTHIGASDGGKYYLSVIAANGCVSKDSVTVSVYPVTPTPVASSNSPVCIGGTINLTASNVPSVISWKWTGPGGYNASNQNPSKSYISYADSGDYTIKVIASNGCVSLPVTTHVSVIKGPSVSIYASPKDSICAGNNMALVALPFSLGSSTPSYEWYRNNSFTGSTGGSLISAAVNDGDVFYVSMIANGSGCNTPILSNKVTMAVLPATPPPSVTISATPGTNIWPGLNVNFTSGNLTHGGSKPGYQWLLNGHNITGATNANWGSTTLNNNDTVCLLITSSEQCATPKTANSNCIEMNIATGIDKTGVETLKLYPNPNNGVFTLETAEKGKLHIYNLQGQQIAEYNISTIKTNIQLPALSNGIYIARFTTTDNKTTITKITVQQ